MKLEHGVLINFQKSILIVEIHKVLRNEQSNESLEMSNSKTQVLVFETEERLESGTMEKYVLSQKIFSFIFSLILL